MDLVATDIVQFEQRAGRQFVLESEAVLIALRIEVDRIECLQQQRRLRQGRVERRKLPRCKLREVDVVQRRCAIVGWWLTQSAGLRNRITSVEGPCPAAHNQFLIVQQRPSESESWLPVVEVIPNKRAARETGRL